MVSRRESGIGKNETHESVYKDSFGLEWRPSFSESLVYLHKSPSFLSGYLLFWESLTEVRQTLGSNNAPARVADSNAMSQRGVRVNELIKREISDILHTRFRSEAVRITIIDVEVSSDLRNARVFFSVLGDEARVREAQLWLDGKRREIRHYLGKRVVLKYLPHLVFRHDSAIERGMNLIEILDELEEEDEGK